ncbi:hypothetical protein AGMMS49546_39260 [Spirochaetia bacterium]|nr:hypothetical protein AGMMS49546_39260 [Spirochaetia bacterium]
MPDDYTHYSEFNKFVEFSSNSTVLLYNLIMKHRESPPNAVVRAELQTFALAVENAMRASERLKDAVTGKKAAEDEKKSKVAI